MSQVNGKTTDGDGAAAAGVSCVAAGLGPDGVDEDDDGGGRVTEALFEGLMNRTSSSL
jgi:hypothetical protein